MDPHLTTRRRVLETGVLGLLSGATGCLQPSEPTGGSPTPPRYTAVRDSAVYLGPQIDDELPSFVTVVESATTADIAVVAPETTLSGETLVSWLVDGVPTGMFGEPAITRLLELLRDGGVTDHFEGEYLSAGRQPHDVAVFDPNGDEMNTYTGRIEGREPSLVGVLDRALAFVLEDNPE